MRTLLLVYFALSLSPTLSQWGDVKLDPGNDGALSETRDDFTLIPVDEGEQWNSAVQEVIKNWDSSFVEKYKSKAKELENNVGAQLNSWIVNLAGIQAFMIHLVKLFLNVAMIIGFLMIVYSGYIYASWVFTGNVTKGNNAIKNAVIGLLIVIFSYTIIKIVTAMFL